MSVTCPACGFVSEGTTICPHCGQTLDTTAQPNQPQQQMPSYPQQPPASGYPPPAAPPAPGYPPPGSAPGPGYYATQPMVPPSQKTNVLAIISLIASFICSGVVGIILAIIALSQIKRTGEGGKGLAIAAIVVSAISLVFTGIAIALGLFSTTFNY